MGIKQLAKNIEQERKDTTERLDGLRLQARAWRILALIALVDQEAGRKHAQWLFFNTLPWVNGEAVEKFIAENEKRAEACGIEAGVFGKPEAREA
jgi:hypothetical protein